MREDCEGYLKTHGKGEIGIFYKKQYRTYKNTSSSFNCFVLSYVCLSGG